MRKRIINVKGTKYIRVASCKAGLLRFAMPRVVVAILLCVVMCACATSNEHSRSWQVYCAKYNVNPDHPTVEQENFWLDCYAGSVEEEQDLGL